MDRRFTEAPLQRGNSTASLADAKKGDVLTLEFSRGGKNSSVKIQR